MAWLQKVDDVLDTGIEATLALVGYLCYSHLGLGSTSASSDNKDILLVVGFI